MAKRYFETDIEVDYLDTDAMGHVSAPVYYAYMLRTYLKFMHELLQMPLPQKLPHIMIKTACEYLHPARYGDVIKVASSVTHLGSKSFALDYLMTLPRQSETVLAKASSTHVMFDYAANATTPMTDDFKQRVMSFQGAL
ncbi:acyl-CoA thioesterase [Dyella sp.]|uniref:acyl-CoA thioesterase n=1 Tax=Dyella sp. TaxID=1869338 RepID=UPI002FD9DE5E